MADFQDCGIQEAKAGLDLLGNLVVLLLDLLPIRFYPRSDQPITIVRYYFALAKTSSNEGSQTIIKNYSLSPIRSVIELLPLYHGTETDCICTESERAGDRSRG